jgi:GT2 family glycosyltransferase
MNGGGSAGFARAMLAALDDQKKHGLTHCLLMDDDVVFTRHAVERAGVFARLLKDEYRGAMLGGAMLLLGKADVQEEAGARVDINVITPIKKGRCLSSLTAVLENEIEESISYSSWFFCCFSLDDSLRNNLPLPFFFQYDDIEFSLRNYERRKITLNGVCVWHESFDKKRSISKDYYYGVRNRLIMLAIHSETFFRAFSKTRLKIILLKKTAFLLLTYRYNAAELVMRAGEDFLLGIDWLGSVDPEALNREVAGAGEPFSDVSFVTGELRLSEQDARSRGFLLARKAVFFNTWTRKGYRVERSLRRMFKALGRLLRLFRAIDKSFARVVTQYRERFRSVVSEEFWRRLLGLD